MFEQGNRSTSVVFLVFFQAEDGIRDPEMSRGLGDVYKRQSQDRALAVSSYLTDLGIDATRVETLGLGPNEPIADNATEEGRAMNRRVQVLVLD